MRNEVSLKVFWFFCSQKNDESWGRGENRPQEQIEDLPRPAPFQGSEATTE